MNKPAGNLPLAQTSLPATESDDMFAHLGTLTGLEIKQQEISTQMSALMVHCGKTRAQLADGLGWPRSRVTKVLSGEGNLTVKTLFQFSRALGYDFDVVFRALDQQARPRQPWDPATKALAPDGGSKYVVVLRSAGEVVKDCVEGRGQSYYITAILNPDGRHAVKPLEAALPNESPQWISLNAFEERPNTISASTKRTYEHSYI